MATSAEDVKKGNDDYQAAFNEDPPAKPEQSDDEAFGIGPEGSPAEEASESPEQEKSEDAPVAVVDTAADGEPGGETAMESQGDKGDGGVPADMARPGEAAVEAKPAVEVQPKATGANGAPMSEQQLRSWEGRLKKAQADLDAAQKTGKAESSNGTGDEDGDTAKGAPNATDIDALEQVSEQAKTDDPKLSQAADDMADKVESGEVSPDDAMKQLAEDFGPDFVNMIVSIAKKIAAEAGATAADSKVGEVKGAVHEIVGHINDSQSRQHFKEIAAKHPDFREVGDSQGFKDFVGGHENPEEAKRIANSGSSDEINGLLDQYKAHAAKAQAPQEEAAKPADDPVVAKQMDDAEGVRSSGMALPEQPKAASSGYEDAWKEFA